MNRSKYRNRKTELAGVMYDSAAEARRARELQLLVAAREVAYFDRQVNYSLHGSGGNLICIHIVDFRVTYPDGHVEVEDVKGVRTKDWSIKHKLFLDNYPDIPYRVIGKARKKRKRIAPGRMVERAQK